MSIPALRSTPPPVQWVTVVLLSGLRCRGVKLAFYLHPVPRLGKPGAISALPLMYSRRGVCNFKMHYMTICVFNLSFSLARIFFDPEAVKFPVTEPAQTRGPASLPLPSRPPALRSRPHLIYLICVITFVLYLSFSTSSLLDP